MIRAHFGLTTVNTRIPRESGDDPPLEPLTGPTGQYSPRERG